MMTEMVKKRIMVCLVYLAVIFLQAGCFMDENQTVRAKATKYLKSRSDMTGQEIRIFIQKGNIGEERLLELAKSKSWNVRIIAAQNERLPVEYLEKMLDDKSWKVARVCSWNPNFTEPMLEKLMQHKNRYVRVSLVNHAELSIENLILLSKDESSLVRGQAAKNSRLPETEMRRLLQDESFLVKLGLAANRKVPMDILMIFSEDDDPKLRVKVAANPSLPETEMRRLFSENESISGKLSALQMRFHRGTKSGLVKNPNTPLDILIELSKDEESYMRNDALQHPKMKQYLEKE